MNVEIEISEVQNEEKKVEFVRLKLDNEIYILDYDDVKLILDELFDTFNRMITSDKVNLTEEYEYLIYMNRLD